MRRLVSAWKKTQAWLRITRVFYKQWNTLQLQWLCRLLKENLLEFIKYNPGNPVCFFLNFSPPGHFYSPLPDIRAIRSAKPQIFKDDAECKEIFLNEGKNLSLFEEFKEYYGEMPFAPEKKAGLRYYFNNSFFSYGDGVVLYSMLRHFKPRRVVEIGSGFSSALMLDVSEKFLNGTVEFTFIEPYPERLKEIAGQSPAKCKLIQDFVQSVDMSVFRALEKGDILFIDSSHVGKIGSDVLHILFNILPEIKEGVIIHIHDIFWPFEYPEKWIENGRAWNEVYLLRAFLACNRDYEILFFNSYFENRHADKIQRHMPLMSRRSADPYNFPNSSVWLRKLSPSLL